MPDPKRESVIITPSQDDLDLIRGYTVAKWKKYDNFKCLKCQYATLWENKMKKHQAADAHYWPFPGPPLPEGVVSPDTDDDVPVYE